MNRPATSPSDQFAPNLKPAELAEVRYSLPQMLAELRLERTTGLFAMEKLDQNEIGKLFKAPRRAKSKQ
ncbi:MAG: hypothetical protein H7343_17810 [Undibacterium sp.]|nr:hypothetical protein [Opitutaceae bacterium]